MNSATRIGGAYIILGMALPFAAITASTYFIQPAHSEDYGAGLLVVLSFFASLVFGLILTATGTFRLASALRRAELLRPLAGVAYAIVGAVSVLGMLIYLGFFVSR